MPSTTACSELAPGKPGTQVLMVCTACLHSALTLLLLAFLSMSRSVYFGAAGTNHNYLNSMRVGEASHPGPKPQAALQAFIKQAVQQALQQAIASFDLSAFLRGQIPSQQPAAATLPPGTRAGRRKRAKLKKAAAKLARAGGSQGVSAVPSAAANAEAGAPKGAKAKTKGKNNEPAKGKGAGAKAPMKGDGRVYRMRFALPLWSPRQLRGNGAQGRSMAASLSDMSSSLISTPMASRFRSRPLQAPSSRRSWRHRQPSFS